MVLLAVVATSIGVAVLIAGAVSLYLKRISGKNTDNVDDVVPDDLAGPIPTKDTKEDIAIENVVPDTATIEAGECKDEGMFVLIPI